MNLREYAAQQRKAQETPQNSPQGADEQQERIKAPPPPTDPYKRIYRAVFDYHERHKPHPTTENEWLAAAEDLGKTANELGNNPFANFLLTAVYDELQRQWKQAQGNDTG
ncbi:MAG: hypothetical protein IJ181_10040 [Acidaminococcaceae bacterium]|nr:hypothetical protein [Acidaminococcaceae bacterium]